MNIMRRGYFIQEALDADESSDEIVASKPDSQLAVLDLRDARAADASLKRNASREGLAYALVYGIRSPGARSSAMWGRLSSQHSTKSIIFAKVLSVDASPLPDWVFIDIQNVMDLRVAWQQLVSTEPLAWWLLRYDQKETSVHLEGNYKLDFKHFILLSFASRMRHHAVKFHVDRLQALTRGALYNYMSVNRDVTFLIENTSLPAKEPYGLSPNYCWDLVPPSFFGDWLPRGMASLRVDGSGVYLLRAEANDGEPITSVTVSFDRGDGLPLFQGTEVRAVHIRGSIPLVPDFSFLAKWPVTELTMNRTGAISTHVETAIKYIRDGELLRLALRENPPLFLTDTLGEKFRRYPEGVRYWILDVTGTQCTASTPLSAKLKHKGVRIVQNDDYEQEPRCPDCGGLTGDILEQYEDS